MKDTNAKISKEVNKRILIAKIQKNENNNLKPFKRESDSNLNQNMDNNTS